MKKVIKITKDNIRRKHLYSHTEKGIATKMYCLYNIKTDHITITSSFISNHGGSSITNPKCGAYLGIYIAERVLSKVFENVERMSLCNPGYDFICSKNKKIDVKSSCIRECGKYRHWTFGINKNKIADYFLCLAFDNRTDLNPLHLWLIPSEILNDKTNVSISESTINKWKQYEQSIDKVISCCNIFKGGENYQS